MLRRRYKIKTSLEERLLRFAEEARTAADQVPPGPEQDALIKKAWLAETVAGEAHRLRE